jgi:hypothetical protein
MKFWCKLPEDDDNTETCDNLSNIKNISIYDCAFVGFTAILTYINPLKPNNL